MIDFMLMEAVALKISDEDKKQQEKQKREEFKRDRENLKQHQ